MAGHFNYETNTWYELINPKGVRRTIVAVDDSGSGHTLVTNSCGHVTPRNKIFHYTAGEETNCWSCLYAPENVIRSEKQ